MLTDFLLDRATKKTEKRSFADEREAIGSMAGRVGLFLNLLLASSKIFMGMTTKSLAILGDGINNLTDAISSVISLFSFRIAARPADKEHPYGHGRIEYFMSSLVALLVLYAALNLLRESVRKILNPGEMLQSIPAILVMIFAVLVKLWLWQFYRKAGKKAHSQLLHAVSLDSLSDVFATGTILVALPISLLLHYNLDGILGLLVSLIIFRAGIQLLRATVDKIMGGQPSAEELTSIAAFLKDQPGIEGTHDLMIHDYGPGKVFVTVHAEVDGTEDVMELHEKIDSVERKALDEMGIHMTIHMDPLLRDDPQTLEAERLVSDIIQGLSPEILFHDLRLVGRAGKINLIFDLLLPVNYPDEDQFVKDEALAALRNRAPQFNPIITIDRDYLQTQEG